MDIDGFKLYLIRKGNKKSGIDFYISNLKRLSQLSDLHPQTVDKFLLDELEKGRAPSYLNDYVCSLRAYGKYKGIDYSTLKFFKERPTEKATLSIEEIQSFLCLPPPICRKKMPDGKYYEYNFKVNVYNKWTLFFKILCFSGMRCGEVASLGISQIDFGRGVFVLKDTKTNDIRYVPIAPVIIEELKTYISSLEGELLFAQKNGKPLSDTEWGRRFHGRLNRLGIKRPNLTPYSLRHSFITRMLEEDVNIFKIQKIVGHRRLETTAHYTHLTTKDIQKTIRLDPLTRKSNNQLEIVQLIIETLKAFKIDEDHRFNFSLLEGTKELVFKLTWS